MDISDNISTFATVNKNKTYNIKIISIMATISLQNFNFNGGNNMSMVSEPKPLSWTEINGCKNFDRPVSIAEAIEAVNADYTVTKEHLYGYRPHSWCGRI